MLLKDCLDQGVSKAEYSGRFGVSRRAVHGRIAAGPLDRDLWLRAHSPIQQARNFFAHLTPIYVPVRRNLGKHENARILAR